MRVIEAVELVACRVFDLAHQTRQRITFGDVEHHWPSWLATPPTVPGGTRVLAPRVTA